MEATLRVLCVDDERVARTVMVEMLRGRGVQAEAEADPLVALERLRTEPFDVLVTDLAILRSRAEGHASTPVIDGIELVSRARGLARPPGCVLMTSLEGPRLDLSGLPLGAVAGVLAKPFSETDLWEVVDQAARANRRTVDKPEQVTVDLLLLEDDPQQAARVRGLLERGGVHCEVVHCSRLDEALEVLSTHSFAAALVDLTLSDAGGLDVVRRIRTVSPETPIVALIDEGEAWSEAAIELGAQEVLQKDAVSVDVLAGAVQRALKRQSAERRVAKLAFRDALTGLFNARYFLRRLSDAVALSAREGKPCAVILLDLDGFKPVNDEFGHAVGDAALKEVASRLKEALRDYDTLARMGGDGFAVLLQGIDDRNVLGGLAQRLVELVAKPMRFEQASFALGASVGVAIAPDCAAEPGRLLRGADLAMCAAKAAGKGTVRFAVGSSTDNLLPPGTSLPPPASVPHVWLHSQMDARDKRRISHRVELTLLEDPDRNTADVLRSFARLETDVALTVAALRAAVAASKPTEGLSMTIPTELFGIRLLDGLRDVLSPNDVSRVTLEAHAPSLLAGTSSQRLMLETFQDAGFHLAMRDFGSAAMRPDLLASLPLDALRVDSRIVTRAAEGGSAERLLRALVAFGQALGFSLGADDLRTDQACRIALEAGCDQVWQRHSVRELIAEAQGPADV